METLKLYYPAKPFWITQAWGISNPSYEQFGFSKHNGVDFRIGDDRLVHCPVPATVTETGYDSAKGNYVRLITNDEWLVNGVECKVGLVFMHGEKILVKDGDVLGIGDPLMIPDNTGFSTGPHTHMSVYRLGGLYWNERLDTDPVTNNTFDPHPFWTGYSAQDYTTLIHTLRLAVAALIKLVGQLVKRRSAPPAQTQ